MKLEMVAWTKLLKPAYISVVMGMLFFIPSSAQALLTGTSVTGSLKFTDSNLFDPTSGLVPAGCGNSAPENHIDVTIGIGKEFCSQPSTILSIEADFSDDALHIQLALEGSSGQANITSLMFAFIDDSFSGLTVTEQSDNFTNGGMNCSLADTTLTCNWPGSPIPRPSQLGAVYSFAQATPVPEPSSLALLGLGMAALVARGRKYTKHA